jgi:hypothetical protein
LTAAGGRSAGLIEQTGPYPLDANDLVPVLDAIGPDRELTVVVPCEVAGGGADLQVNARLVGSAGGETITVPFFLRGRDSLGSVQIVRLGIPPGSLGPGGYNLYVFLQDPVSGETAYGRIVLTVSGR